MRRQRLPLSWSEQVSQSRGEADIMEGDLILSFLPKVKKVSASASRCEDRREDASKGDEVAPGTGCRMSVQEAAIV